MKKTTTAQPVNKVSMKPSDMNSLVELIKQREKLELQLQILKNKSKNRTKEHNRSKK